MTRDKKMLKLKSISKRYKDQQVLDGINFEVGKKSLISIVGKSGVGKTTLLSILSGLVSPDAGSILFEDKDITDLDEEGLAHFRLMNVGIIFQDFKIISSLSVFDNVYLALHPRKDIDKAEKSNMVNMIISQVGLEHKVSETTDNLSGGEKQRVAIARSLVGKPKLVLADEPTGNLDDVTSESILKLFEKLHRELSTTFIIITHDIDIAKRTQVKYKLTSKGLSLYK